MVHELSRVISAEDWAEMHEIRRAVLFTPDRHASAYDENHPDDRAENNLAFLLLWNNQPVGTARLDLRRSEGIIRLIAVVPDQQRRGHGSALDRLIVIEAQSRGLDRLFVHAATDAVGFYEKTGWTLAEQSEQKEAVAPSPKSVLMTKSV